MCFAFVQVIVPITTMKVICLSFLLAFPLYQALAKVMLGFDRIRNIKGFCVKTSSNGSFRQVDDVTSEQQGPHAQLEVHKNDGACACVVEHLSQRTAVYKESR